MIRKAMKELHITQKMLEEKTQIAQASISRICNGRQKPTLCQAVQLKEILNIPLEYWESDEWKKQSRSNVKKEGI